MSDRAARRLLLVDPYPRNNPYHLTVSERRAVWFPKLSLPVIAAYTPESWEVVIQDEAVQDIDFDQPCDLVGLSIMTCYAPRAYEIAGEMEPEDEEQRQFFFRHLRTGMNEAWEAGRRSMTIRKRIRHYLTRMSQKG
jgi:hypothetical protein